MRFKAICKMISVEQSPLFIYKINLLISLVPAKSSPMLLYNKKRHSHSFVNKILLYVTVCCNIFMTGNKILIQCQSLTEASITRIFAVLYCTLLYQLLQFQILNVVDSSAVSINPYEHLFQKTI